MRYYKITNETEKHNDMQYRDGLNVDVSSFNPRGDCESGGIYFSREDILAFLDYGPWIREVRIDKNSLGEDSKVYENPGFPKKWKAHKVWLGPRRKIDLIVIKELVNEGLNIHVDNERILRWASENNYSELIKFLIEKRANIHVDNDFIFQNAFNTRDLELMKFLVEKGANIHVGDEYILRYASRYGCLEIVKLLIEKDADIHAQNDYPLRWASGNGHFEVVKFLVESGADIHADNDQALKWAFENKYLKVKDFLIENGASE